jgi:hypothetical protein
MSEITEATTPPGPQLEGDSPSADQPAGADRSSASPAPRIRSWWRPAAVFAGGAVVLFLIYLRLSEMWPVDSDGASNVLQAWDMLHGNLLLHGWTLTDVSFYTTELPQYALVELLVGLSPTVVHVAAAMTYTLLVIGVALLARGRATGTEGWVRMAVAAGILLAPQAGAGTYVLLLSPDHVGTGVPLLAALLVLDRAPRRWWAVAAFLFLMLIAQIGDPLATIEGAVPVVIVCLVRLYPEAVRNRRLGRENWYDLSLLIGTLLSIKVASAVLAVIAKAGGFHVFSVPPFFTYAYSLSAHFWLAIESVLLLNGADFTGQPLGASAGLALLHLVGVALVLWAVARGLRRFFADRDLVVQILVVSFILVLVSFVVGNRAYTVMNAREIAGVLPFGAVLAGRMLGGRLMSLRLLPALALVLAGYLVALIYGVSLPAVPNPNRPLITWLESHHLYYGVAGYWESNSVTLYSHERVQVRYLGPLNDGKLAMAAWESQRSWYNPKLHDARFVIWDRYLSSSVRDVTATFGRPAHSYRVAGERIFVYDHNLLRDLHGTFILPQVRISQPTPPGVLGRAA